MHDCQLEKILVCMALVRKKGEDKNRNPVAALWKIRRTKEMNAMREIWISILKEIFKFNLSISKDV